MKLKFWKNMNKKDINIDELTDCQNNAADMAGENAANEQPAADATDTEADGNEAEMAGNTAEPENGAADENGNEAEGGEENSPCEAAQEQIAELKDKYLRSVAEFDNYRKRTLRRRQN